MFFISALAETNRHPFDLPEAEAELVAGYNVEYSAAGFALFFLGEYANMIMMSSVTTILFLGGWLSPINLMPFTFVPGPIWFGLKVCFFVLLFIWARAAYPRYRYDQLMRLGWKIFLPLSLGMVLFVAGTLIALTGYHFKFIMTFSLLKYLNVTIALFLLGIWGIVLNRKNIIILLMSIELMLLSINLNFVTFSVFPDDLMGQYLHFNSCCSRISNWSCYFSSYRVRILLP